MCFQYISIDNLSATEALQNLIRKRAYPDCLTQCNCFQKHMYLFFLYKIIIHILFLLLLGPPPYKRNKDDIKGDQKLLGRNQKSSMFYFTFIFLEIYHILFLF